MLHTTYISTEKIWHLWILPLRHTLNKDLGKQSPLSHVKENTKGTQQVHGGGISFCIQYFLIQVKVRVLGSTEDCWALFDIPLTRLLPAF